MNTFLDYKIMSGRYLILDKYISKTRETITLIFVAEAPSPCYNEYLYSFSKTEKIDSKQIERSCDDEDPDIPDNDFIYSRTDSDITIRYKTLTSYMMECHKYVRISEHGYFFELSISNPSNDKRLFFKASSELLKPEELMNRTKDELALMRNEIFAAHGYHFKSERYKAYFEGQKWYKPLYDDINDITKQLNGFEKKNIELIKELEREYELTQKYNTSPHIPK